MENSCGEYLIIFWSEFLFSQFITTDAYRATLIGYPRLSSAMLQIWLAMPSYAKLSQQSYKDKISDWLWSPMFSYFVTWNCRFRSWFIIGYSMIMYDMFSYYMLNYCSSLLSLLALFESGRH